MFDTKAIADELKVSVSKTFDVHEQHVNVSVSAGLHEASIMVSINHPSLGDYLKWNMITSKSEATVECRVFGLTVSHCTLDPKMPPCFGCPLAEGYVPSANPSTKS